MCIVFFGYISLHKLLVVNFLIRNLVVLVLSYLLEISPKRKKERKKYSISNINKDDDNEIDECKIKKCTFKRR